MPNSVDGEIKIYHVNPLSYMKAMGEPDLVEETPAKISLSLGPEEEIISSA